MVRKVTSGLVALWRQKREVDHDSRGGRWRGGEKEDVAIIIWVNRSSSGRLDLNGPIDHRTLDLPSTSIASFGLMSSTRNPATIQHRPL